MLPDSILGKRSAPGPKKSEDVILDALRKLSATPKTKSVSGSERVSKHSNPGNPSPVTLADASTELPANTAAVDSEDMNDSDRVLASQLQNYMSQFPGLPQWKAMKPGFFPQSPPQEQHMGAARNHRHANSRHGKPAAPQPSAAFSAGSTNLGGPAHPGSVHNPQHGTQQGSQRTSQNQQKHLALPQTPVVDDLGEKRRRVNHDKPRRAYGKNPFQDRYKNGAKAASGDGEQSRGGAKQSYAYSSQYQPPTPQTPGSNQASGMPMYGQSAMAMPQLVSPPQNQTTLGMYGGTTQPAGMANAVPGMGSAMGIDANSFGYRGQPGFSTGVQSANMAIQPSQLAPAPVVLSKPPVVPSLVAPPRPRWKPQEVTLPRIVDGRLTPETAVDCDDDGGHYIVRVGERFAWRYLIIKLLGQGTFGKVVQAWDEQSQQYCAIKIIRAVPKYRDASKIELRVLSLLSSCDPHGRYKCVRMRECFDYRNHVCIVTDLHDISVYDFLHDNKFAPFPGKHIARFAQQILMSVAHIHSLGLVHTDLKPENVLLASSANYSASYSLGGQNNSHHGGAHSHANYKNTAASYLSFPSASSGRSSSGPSPTSTMHHVSGTGSSNSSSSSSPLSSSAKVALKSKSPSRGVNNRKELKCTDVTLIDFGSAVFEDEYHPSVVSTRHYRAPEIILGTGWSYPCDMWSIGCLLVELCTGRVLFETRDDLEHLHLMQRTLRMNFDQQQLSAAASNTTGSALVSSWPPSLRPLKEQAKTDAVNRMRTITELVYTYAPCSEEPEFWSGFLDLVGKLMAPNPARRITAVDALQHPWILAATN